MLLNQLFHFQLQQCDRNLRRGQFAAPDDFVLLHFLVSQDVVNLLLGMGQRGHRQFDLFWRDGIEVGEFGKHILGGFAKLRTVLDEVMAAGAAWRINAAGHGVNGPTILGGEVGGDQCTTGAVGLDDHRAPRHADDDSIANGKTLLVPPAPEGKLRDYCALLHDSFVELDVLSGINDVQARSQNRNCSPAGLKGPFMRRAIDAPSPATDDCDAGSSQLPSQTFGGLASVECSLPRTDHRDGMRMIRPQFSPRVQHQRRVINLPQQCGVRGVVRRDNGRAELVDSLQFQVQVH